MSNRDSAIYQTKEVSSIKLSSEAGDADENETTALAVTHLRQSVQAMRRKKDSDNTARPSSSSSGDKVVPGGSSNGARRNSGKRNTSGIEMGPALAPRTAGEAEKLISSSKDDTIGGTALGGDVILVTRPDLHAATEPQSPKDDNNEGIRSA